MTADNPDPVRAYLMAVTRHLARTKRELKKAVANNDVAKFAKARAEQSSILDAIRQFREKEHRK
ncbi:MAG: hypothetical protein M0Z91_05835 [Actinomycetota bacterium]|nr:hypothetical protein [Actinomycetota bacterium]